MGIDKGLLQRSSAVLAVGFSVPALFVVAVTVVAIAVVDLQPRILALLV